MEVTPILRLEVVQYIAILDTGIPPSERSPARTRHNLISVVTALGRGAMMSTHQRRLPVERDALPRSNRGLWHSSAGPAFLSRAGIGHSNYSRFAYPAAAGSCLIGALRLRCPTNMLAVTSAPADSHPQDQSGGG